jgi:hypothetical protein
MMNMRNLPWSKTEKVIAKRAFESAYRRECQAVAQRIRDMSRDITTPEDLWHLYDFLRDKRAEIDVKYDYRYSVLLFVFARLLKEGWLHAAELEGLRPEKVSRIGALVNM